MMILLLTLMLITQNSLAQEIEVTEIPTGNGFVLLRTGDVKLITNYTNIVHPINIKDYLKALNIVLENDVMKNLSKDPTIIHLVQEIKNKIFELNPQKREKRGLINLHGKFLKWIGGTMDEDDREEIESKFNTVDKNLNIISDAINNQTTKINVQFELEINKVIATLNEQNSVIDNKMKEMTLISNQMQKSIEMFKTRQLVIENLKFLLTKLEKIEDIILNCRLGILSHNILVTEEIQKYNLNIEHLKYIKTEVAQLKEFILIFIQIPNFSKESYYITNIIPIPNKNNLELETNIDKIIVNKNNVYYYSNNKEIKKLKRIKEKCIKNILKSKLTNCNMVKNSKIEIKRINKDVIITKNLNETELTHNCNNHALKIKKHNIIKFKNCSIKINNVTFSNENIKHIETLVLPNIVKEIRYKEPENISISQIHEMHISNNKEIKLLKYDTHRTSWLSYITGGFLTIVITIIIILFLYSKRKKNGTSIELKIRPESNPKEGVVTYNAAHEGTDALKQSSSPFSFRDDSDKRKIFSFKNS